MSESSANKKPAIKNPLLSSNFAVEDFTHNALILAPAPPIPVKKEEQVSAIFTTGDRTTVPENTDNFSEVNLNTQPERIDSKSAIYSPLEGLDSPAELNLAEQSDPSGISESFDSQSLGAGLSASFAQLPNVASTVFSTFSRVIKGSSPTPGDTSEFNHHHQPQIDQVQNKNTLDELYEHQHPSSQSQVNQPFEPPHEDSPPVIPTFYSPNDPNLTTHPPLHKQVPVAGNTFRLGGTKKKAYAHIPGLSTSATPTIPNSTPLRTDNSSSLQGPTPQQNQFFQPEVTSAGYFDLTAPQPFITPSETIQPPAQESSGKFSFGGLLPAATQLLQKIPSVQDFAHNFTQPPKHSDQFEVTQSSNTSSVNFFSVEGSAPVAQPAFSITQQQINTAPPINPNNFNTSPFLQPSQGTVSDTSKDPLQVASTPISVQNIALVETPPSRAEVAPPPPTFFNPDQIPKTSLSKSENPYSNSRFGKTAVYKNPSLIPSTGQTPVILGTYNPIPSVPVLPNNIFNPLGSTEQAQPLNQGVFESSESNTKQTASETVSTPINLFTPSTVSAPDSFPPPSNLVSFPNSDPQVTPVLSSNAFTKDSAVPDQPTALKPPPVDIPAPQSQGNPYQRKQKPTNTVQNPPVTLPAFFSPDPQITNQQTSNVHQETTIQPVEPFNFFANNQNQLNTTETDSKPQVFADLPTNYPPPLESVTQNLASQQSSTPITSFFVEQNSSSVVEQNKNNTSNIHEIPNQFEAYSTNRQSSIVENSQKIENQTISSFFNESKTVETSTQNQGLEQNLASLCLNDNRNNNILQEEAKITNTFDIYNNNNTSNTKTTITDQPSTKNQTTDNDLPRFTPVHFFIDTPKSVTTNNSNNSSSVNFFDNPTQNEFHTFFDQVPSNNNNNNINRKATEPSEKQTFANINSSSFDQYFKPQEVLPQEKLINQDIYQVDYRDQVVNAAQTSSFSSFRSESVSELNQDFIDYDELPEEMADEIDSGKLSTAPADLKYRPVYYHWFYKTQEDPLKAQWTPFTMKDSMALDEALRANHAGVLVHTDGGRFDVDVTERKRVPVYWKGPPNQVRRCSWFYKALDSRFVPYEEEIAEKLEEEYRIAAMSGEWHKKIPLQNGETVVFHGPSVIVHFLQSQNPDSWGSTAQPTNRPRVVKRGIDDFNIEDGESEQIDHLLFMIHGIGKACDLKFRTIEEAVDEFRSIATQLVQSHYRTSCDLGVVGRVEVLPISWHTELHSEEFGIDEKLKLITLESIPKLRGFANETLLDILFYSSPVFCQHIMDIVGNTMNNVMTLFKKRNPEFSGGVSLGGHSLGSLILFDLLCHQKEKSDHETENLENPGDDCIVVSKTIGHPNLERRTSQTVNYTMGVAGTGQPFINYPQLSFKVKSFFALGSPISMFVTVRGIDKLGQDFKLPTCDGFFNIFHPYDPVAYRCEPLICSSLSSVTPVLIPHHKGRKRMHLELKETMVRVGTDIKQRILFTFKNTMQAVYSLTTKQVTDQQAIEDEVDKVLEEQLHHEPDRPDSASTSTASEIDAGDTDLPLGQLNQSRRIDFVLQEAPLEFFNEYLFALTSHVCYWESEDTILFMMKEIYTSMGIQTDSQIPQNTLTIERPSTSTAKTLMSPTFSTSSDKCNKS